MFVGPLFCVGNVGAVGNRNKRSLFHCVQETVGIWVNTLSKTLEKYALEFFLKKHNLCYLFILVGSSCSLLKGFKLFQLCFVCD